MDYNVDSWYLFEDKNKNFRVIKITYIDLEMDYYEGNIFTMGGEEMFNIPITPLNLKKGVIREMSEEEVFLFVNQK